MKRTVFITGTNSGFGKATAELFASRGWNVAATVRDTGRHTGLFKDLPNVTLFDLDVTNYEQVEQVAQSVIKKYGKIDAVVNNAGYCLIGPAETSSMEQIKQQYETNVFGLFAVTKAFIPHFRENKDGIFINFASSSAQSNYPFIAAYGSTKWAVRGITESLGIELAPFNIQVKAIYPGIHASRIFTKLAIGVTPLHNPAYTAYKRYFKNFMGAQSAISSVTSPASIANEVYKAVENPKGGKLHIISGGDAKFLTFLKKIQSERAFQKTQLGSIMNPVSKGAVSFMKFLLGKNISKLDLKIPEELIN